MENSTYNKNILLFCIVLFLIGGLCIFYRFSLTKSKNNKESDNNEIVGEKIDASSMIGNYGLKRTTLIYEEDGKMTEEPLDEDEELYYDILYLRSDGTFYLSVDNYNANEPSVGTYTFNNNKTITLKESVTYGSDACFYTSDLKTYTVNIKDKNNLTLVYDGRTINFTRGIIESEDEREKAYYITNPKDGVTPTGWEDAWIDCTNLDKK